MEILNPIRQAISRWSAPHLEGADKALKVGDLEQASKLINQASSEIEAVRPLDVGSFKELKDRAVIGGGLEHDHIP